MILEHEKSELLKRKESANLVENPQIFHIDKISFSRNLLKKASRSSSSDSENGENGLPERALFLERKHSGDKMDETTLFAVPEDRYNIHSVLI